MGESDIIVPPLRSHWSLRVVDIIKPFPDNVPANVTFKIVRFFYPPFAVELVNVIPVVDNPELNLIDVGLFLTFVFLTYVLCARWNYFLKAKPYRLPEQQAKSASEKKQLAGDINLPDNATNVIMEPQQLTESDDHFIDTEEYEENDDIWYRSQMDLNGDKQHDLAGQLNRAVRESF
ncbi:hypothetical protein KR059_002722 [Drosophila kikkawai]|nr:hypothetical protein KR059_002722 [Drosophila kikkawai]